MAQVDQPTVEAAVVGAQANCARCTAAGSSGQAGAPSVSRLKLRPVQLPDCGQIFSSLGKSCRTFCLKGSMDPRTMQTQPGVLRTVRHC